MSLLKTLIVDDEENIRNGLKCIVDWKELGFQICGEASNGNEAINQIINLRPDLVILDIHMPALSGIEVIIQIKEYYKKNNLVLPVIIILSGYSDFEYAKQAVNLGAKAYLSKPVDEDDLEAKVREIHSEIMEKLSIQEVSKNVEVLQTKEILQNLIKTGKIDTEQKLETFKFFENHENSNYQVAIFNCEYVKSISFEEVEKELENYFSFFTNIIIPMGKQLIVFIKAKNQVAVQNCIERASKLSETHTFICLGDNEPGIHGLIKSYNDAQNLLKYLFYVSTDSYVSKNKLVPNENESQVQIITDKIKDLIFCIETYDKKKLNELEEELSSIFCNFQQNESITKKNIIYCLVELRNALIAKYPEREISDGNSFEVVPKILETKTFEESFNYFKLVLNDFIENFNFNTSESLIVKVLAYVKTNYSKDLKLEVLGDMFNCNSAYLGKKFKKFTGVQFNSYLDNLRIEEAKEKLINTDLKIYQISKLVGYSNTDYFFMKFKKYTGMTPKEYQNQNNKD